MAKFLRTIFLQNTSGGCFWCETGNFKSSYRKNNFTNILLRFFWSLSKLSDNIQKQWSRGVLSSRCSQFRKIHRKFLNKVAGLTLRILFKTRIWHRCFLVNFAVLKMLWSFKDTFFHRAPLVAAFGYYNFNLNAVHIL